MSRITDFESASGSLPAGTDRFRFLALDGGGVRGVCAAAYLTRLEEIVGPPIRRYFDLICGTSAGGIIAIALALDVPANKILELFRGKSSLIFERRHPRLPKKLAMACDSLYRSDRFHEALRDTLGTDTKLGEARCRLCIPAVNITTGRVVVFKTRHADYLVRDHRLKAWQVAAATAAAPIYFSPFHIPDSGAHVDGGLWANVPANVGITEGLRMDYSLNEIALLSIGTGSSTFQRSATRKMPWIWRKSPWARDGLLGWGEDLVGLTMQAQTDSGENFMLHLVGKERHRRIQFKLPEDGFGFDATDKIGEMAEIAFEKAKSTAEITAAQFLDCEAAPFSPIPVTT